MDYDAFILKEVYKMKIGIDIGGSHIALSVIDEKIIIEKIEYVYDTNFKQNI